MNPLRIAAGSIITILSLSSSGRAERVGLTQTWVDVTRPLAYRIEGGSDEFHAAGEICSLMQSFVVEGGGVTVKFSPKSTRGGSYAYSGKGGGSGIYLVQYDGRIPFRIVAGTETYRLTQTPGACKF
jgi:hypothetical protein